MSQQRERSSEHAEGKAQPREAESQASEQAPSDKASHAPNRSSSSESTGAAYPPAPPVSQEAPRSSTIQNPDKLSASAKLSFSGNAVAGAVPPGSTAPAGAANQHQSAEAFSVDSRAISDEAKSKLEED